MPDPRELTIEAASRFVYREARLLDERRFEEWLGLFAADGRYWIPAGPAGTPGVEPAIVDDDHPTLEDRVRRLRSPVSFAQSPPSRTVHILANLEVERDRDGLWRVHAAGVVHEARLDLLRALPGRWQYVLRHEETGDEPWRIVLKSVRLVHYDQPLYNLTCPL
jgi:3-phenylpropionate/cinnamic acid dioxygenase small subunit